MSDQSSITPSTDDGKSDDKSDDSVSESGSGDDFGDVFEVDQVEHTLDHADMEQEIFMRIMEDDMIKEVPVSLQSSFQVQERIRKTALSLWNLRLKGLAEIKNVELFGPAYNPLILDLQAHHFESIPGLFPIVADMRRIYALQCTSDTDNFDTPDIDKSQSRRRKILDVPPGDILENQVRLMKEVQTLLKDFYAGKINYVSFCTGQARATDPFLTLPAKTLAEVGPPQLMTAHHLRLKAPTELLRLVGLSSDDTEPTFRVGRGPRVVDISIPEKFRSDKKKAEKLIQSSRDTSLTILAGEEVDIVGFLINSKSDNDVKEALDHIITPNDPIPRDSPCIISLASPTQKTTTFDSALRRIPHSAQEAADIVIRSNDLDILEACSIMRPLGFSIQTIGPDQWARIRVKIEQTAASPFTPIWDVGYTNRTLPPCSLTDKWDLLRDEIYTSKLMQMAYGTTLTSTSDNISECKEHRFNRLFSSHDNGMFYFLQSYLTSPDRPTIKDEVDRLSKLVKALQKSSKSPDKSVKSEQTLETVDELRKTMAARLRIPKKTRDQEADAEAAKIQLEMLKNLKAPDQTSELRLLAAQAANFLFNARINTERINSARTMTDAEIGRIIHDLANTQANAHADDEDDEETQGDNAEHAERNSSQLAALKGMSGPLKEIMDDINRLRSSRQKVEAIFALIRNDGLAVGKIIYSVRFKQPMLCGHWQLIMYANQSRTQSDRERWTTRLITEYGSSGKAGSEECAVCGSYLDRTVFYEAFDFGDHGQVQLVRQQNEVEKRDGQYMHLMDVDESSISQDVRICKGKTFKTEVEKSIRDEDQVRKAGMACDLLDRIIAKLDMNIPPKHFLGLVLSTSKDSTQILSYGDYVQEKIRAMKVQKNMSEAEAMRLSQSDSFLQKAALAYSAHFSGRFGTLLLAHLLWYLRATFPTPEMGPGRSTSCSFFGFDGDQGVEFMLCLIMEMKTIRARVTVHGERIERAVRKEEVEQHFRFWVRNLESHYRRASQRAQTMREEARLMLDKVGSTRTEFNGPSVDWADVKAPALKGDFVKDVYQAWKKGDGARTAQMLASLILRNKHLSASYNNFLNDVISKEAKTDKKTIETTCCATLLKPSASFLSFYEEMPQEKVEQQKPVEQKVEQKEKQGKEQKKKADDADEANEADEADADQAGGKGGQALDIPEELAVIQKQLSLLRMHQWPTQFSTLHPVRPLDVCSTFPNDLSKYEKTFMHDGVMTFCIDGPSYGSTHSFLDKNLPEIERCVKCGWYSSKLAEKKTETKEFVGLIEKGWSLNMKQNTSTPIKKTSDMVSLKREAMKNLKSDSLKLGEKLARLSEARSKIEKAKSESMRIADFLNNMDNFNENTPDPPKGSPEKDFVAAREIRGSIAQQKMRDYINLLRKNISRVANGYEVKPPKLEWMSEREAEKWRERLVNDQGWLEKFLTKSNKPIFARLKFDYTFSDIAMISGTNDVYKDSEKKWFLDKPSFFTPTDAALVLKHYFIVQCMHFIDLAKEGAPIFADFLIHFLDKIAADRNVLNLPASEMTRWKDAKAENRALSWFKYYETIQDEDRLLFNAPYRQKVELDHDDPYVEPTEADIAEEIEQHEEEEEVRAEVEHALGEDASEQAVESAVRDAMAEISVEDEIQDEIFDNPILEEGEEVMDSGFEYGQMPQGTEIGDEFGEYTLNEAFDPIHEPDVSGIAQ